MEYEKIAGVRHWSAAKLTPAIGYRVTSGTFEASVGNREGCATIGGLIPLRGCRRNETAGDGTSTARCNGDLIETGFRGDSGYSWRNERVRVS